MTMPERSSDKSATLSHNRQYSTFYVNDRLYGIDVTEVQEVVRPLPLTVIPLTDSYIRGLINLRGQVATAIGLRELFGFESAEANLMMNVVCKYEGNLVSLQVDEIGDVVEVSPEAYEQTPPTVAPEVKQFMTGVYKHSESLLSIIDIAQVIRVLNINASNSEATF